MPRGLLADAVVVVHFLFIAFAVAGGLLALRWRRVVLLHVPAVLWACGIELAGWGCPLTPLENRLRQAQGAAGYAGGFVEHYLVPMVYPPGLTRGLQIGLGVAVVVLNAGVYALVWQRRRRPAR